MITESDGNILIDVINVLKSQKKIFNNKKIIFFFNIDDSHNYNDKKIFSTRKKRLMRLLQYNYVD